MSATDQSEYSIEDLASGSLEVWTEWLRGATLAFYGPTSIEDRITAFAPLTVHPTSDGPAGDIARQLRQIGRNAVKVAPKAATEVLRSWSLGGDRPEGATLLIELAIQLGSLNLYPALVRMLDQAVLLSPEPQQELAFLVGAAANQYRFKRTEIAGLLQRISRIEAVTPAIIADLAVAFTVGNPENLERLPDDLLDILPNLADSSKGGDVASAIGRRLQSVFQDIELRMAFSARPREPLDVVLLRRALYSAVFPMEQNADGDDFLDPDAATIREFEQRTGLSILGNGLGDEADPLARDRET
jgi:hypothetical protein